MWEIEERPYVQIQKSFQTTPIKWTWRNRFEYRIRERKKTTRYRLHLKAESKSKFFSLQPFISNEFFYDLDKQLYNKNWLAIGVKLPKLSFGRPTVYYKNVIDYKDDAWTSPEHVIVFKLSI